MNWVEAHMLGGVHNTQEPHSFKLKEVDLNFGNRVPVDGTIDRSLIFTQQWRHHSIVSRPLQDTGDLQDSATDSGLTEGPNEPSCPNK